MDQPKILRHVVLFAFKSSASAADCANVVSAFAALPARIPEIRKFEWGTNVSSEGLHNGFTHCFTLSFESESDRNAYLTHSQHAAFVETLQPFVEKALVIDYWAESVP